MGRFYADIRQLQQHDTLNVAVFAKFGAMPILESAQNRSAHQVDRDGDTTMTDILLPTAPVSPFKEKFNFDWFSFDGGKASAKPAEVSPLSPEPEARKLSISTISPTSYFAEVSPSTPSEASTESQESLRLDTNRPRKSQLVLPSPPNKPLNWVWQCHICRSRYPLSVTRRCLNDGHYYCSGQTNTTQRNSKRRKANRSCTSEFDYVGWQEWEKWRRKCMVLKAYVADKDEGPTIHGCEGCSFPSQCRYESRPAHERLPFDRYINAKDLKAMVQDEVEGLVSPEKVAFEEVRLSRKYSTVSTKPSAAVKLATPIEDAKKTNNNSSKANNDTAGGKPASKRQRFYSTFGGSKPDLEQNVSRAASNSKAQGSFNPNLPSVSASSLALVSNVVSGSKSKPNDDVDDLATIEAALKVALAGQRTQKVVVPRKSVVSDADRPRNSTGKRRVNSKLDNPEFEITSEDIENASALRKIVSTPTLTRSESQQRLLTGFFRQGKAKDRDKSYTEKLRKAAADADIEAFLQSKPAEDSFEPVKRSVTVNTAGSNSQHFEDIMLSPKAKGNFKEMLDLANSDQERLDTDPAKKQIESVAGSAESSEKPASAASSLAFLNFGFGKR